MPSPIQLIPASALGELPPAEHLGDTKLIARGFNIVFGASGAFKSFYTLDAALSLAQSAPVVYIAAEGSGGLFKRVGAWCAYHDAGPGQMYFICQEVNLLDVQQVRDLIATINDVKPVLVVFDTLARCIPGGDENSAKDMGMAVRNSALVQRDLACAVAWVHHSNRADRGERGSGAMRGAADAMIELTANGDSVVRVICSKLKDEEPWATEGLRFCPVGDSGVLLPSDWTDEARLSTQELQVLEFLALEVFEPSGAKALQIVNAVNIPERKVYHILSHLKRELHIQHDSKGDPYRLTDSGRELLRKRLAKSRSSLSLVIPAVRTGTAPTANSLQIITTEETH